MTRTDTAHKLKALTVEEFIQLGAEHVGYIKAVPRDEGVRYHIVAANGEVMAEAGDYDAARHALAHFDLDHATLH